MRPGDKIEPMSDMTRIPGNRQLWITRGHLAALGVATLFIAILAFLVGVQVGRTQGQPVRQAASVGLVPEVGEEDAIEDLLREVEHAQDRQAKRQAANETEASAPQVAPPPKEAPTELTFPDTLAESAPPPIPTEEEVVEMAPSIAEPPVEEVPEPPEEVTVDVPESGWSVQIASYATAQEADAHITKLSGQGETAYRIAALVKGQTWYRVRVGSFGSRDRADHARNELSSRLARSGLLVVEAP
jgi:DedD protein